MNIEIIPHYHIIVKEESDEYRFYIYVRDDIYHKGDSLYSTRGEAVYKGQVWLRQQYELDRLALYED